MATQHAGSFCFLGLILLSGCIFSGCFLFPPAVVPGIAPHQQSLVETDMPVLAGYQDLIRLAAEVGESLGYKVSLMTDHTLLLVYQTGVYRGMITGEVDSLQLFVSRIEVADPHNRATQPPEIVARLLQGKEPTRFTCKSVRLALYGEGTYDPPERLRLFLDEFKNKLLARLGHEDNLGLCK
jgi:hypothetical protein